MLSVIGFTAFINNINKFASSKTTTSAKQQDATYGGSAYGL